MTESRQICEAFLAAQSRRPYRADDDLIKALTPPGGEWTTEAPVGAICRSIMWGRTEVAHVNPRGDLDDVTEGQIAMGLRALPLLDCTVRTILVLAENADNLPLIKRIAESATAFVEAPAPRIAEPDEED